jgi:hypothetical protein
MGGTQGIAIRKACYCRILLILCFFQFIFSSAPIRQSFKDMRLGNRIASNYSKSWGDHRRTRTIAFDAAEGKSDGGKGISSPSRARAHARGFWLWIAASQT